jgi:hypothetical protein
MPANARCTALRAAGADPAVAGVEPATKLAQSVCAAAMACAARAPAGD